MYTLEKSFSFESGHSLTHHDGKCRQPHGHSYVLTVVIKGSSLMSSGPKKNMLADFSDLSTTVKPMIKKYFDHKWLNDTLKSDSPTSEHIAQWIYNYLKPQIPHLHSITLSETKSSKVTYQPNV